MKIDVEAWYRKYGAMVLRRCRKLLKDEQLAVQAMQDVFVKVLDYQARLKDEYPSSLLYRMATNTCLNIIRDEKKEIHPESEEILGTIADYDDREESTIYRMLLDHLFKKEEPSTRAIATMYYVDRMTWEEVAQTVNMSVSGVRKRMRIFKEKMKHHKGGIYGE